MFETDSDIDEMHPAGAWEANGMSEDPGRLEAKWVRVQAAVDEFSDELAMQLRRVIGEVSEENYGEAIAQLTKMIEAIEVFEKSEELGDD